MGVRIPNRRIDSGADRRPPVNQVVAAVHLVWVAPRKAVANARPVTNIPDPLQPRYNVAVSIYYVEVVYIGQDRDNSVDSYEPPLRVGMILMIVTHFFFFVPLLPPHFIQDAPN